jgi:hypothetical protein
LAVIVRSDAPENIGVLVHVIEPHPVMTGYWYVKVLGHAVAANKKGKPPAGGAGARVRCLDADMRPIRDPGEDIKDETLSWLPVPIKELEHE